MSPLSPLDRHERIALATSGGKDSLACVYLLRDELHRITCYHLDTGQLLPEMQESVARIEAMVPHFVRIETNVAGWIERHGMPSDLVPHSAHPVGMAMGEAGAVLVNRYDCCGANLMAPFMQRMKDDGITLLIRGTKAVDMNRLPRESGEVEDGVELWLPLQDWSHAEVFDYLRSVGAVIPRVYEDEAGHPNSPECWGCTAWWSEGRASYLQRHHPDLFAAYRDRMRVVIRELHRPMTHLANEVAAMGGLREVI